MINRRLSTPSRRNSGRFERHEIADMSSHIKLVGGCDAFDGVVHEAIWIRQVRKEEI